MRRSLFQNSAVALRDAVGSGGLSAAGLRNATRKIANMQSTWPLWRQKIACNQRAEATDMDVELTSALGEHSIIPAVSMWL